MNNIDPLAKAVISLVVPVALAGIKQGYSVIKKNLDNRKAGIIVLKKSQYSVGQVTINS